MPNEQASSEKNFLRQHMETLREPDSKGNLSVSDKDPCWIVQL